MGGQYVGHVRFVVLGRSASVFAAVRMLLLVFRVECFQVSESCYVNGLRRVDGHVSGAVTAGNSVATDAYLRPTVTVTARRCDHAKDVIGRVILRRHLFEDAR